MTTRTYIKTKKGHEEVWEWEETTEVLAALKVYWDTVRENAAKASASIVF
jgi:ligand-binding SRPBCC domain-containing protein